MRKQKYRIVKRYDVAMDEFWYSVEKQEFWFWKPFWTYVGGSLSKNVNHCETVMKRLIEIEGQKLVVIKEAEAL